MIETIFMPFHFSFMNQAFIVIAMITVPTSLLSCYLVLKGWSLMGDAISHAVLPGVILAYLLNIPLVRIVPCTVLNTALYSVCPFSRPVRQDQ